MLQHEELVDLHTSSCGTPEDVLSFTDATEIDVIDTEIVITNGKVRVEFNALASFDDRLFVAPRRLIGVTRQHGVRHRFTRISLCPRLIVLPSRFQVPGGQAFIGGGNVELFPVARSVPGLPSPGGGLGREIRLVKVSVFTRQSRPRQSKIRVKLHGAL